MLLLDPATIRFSCKPILQLPELNIQFIGICLIQLIISIKVQLSMAISWCKWDSTWINTNTSWYESAFYSFNSRLLSLGPAEESSDISGDDDCIIVRSDRDDLSDFIEKWSYFKERHKTIIHVSPWLHFHKSLDRTNVRCVRPSWQGSFNQF